MIHNLENAQSFGYHFKCHFKLIILAQIDGNWGFEFEVSESSFRTDSNRFCRNAGRLTARQVTDKLVTPMTPKEADSRFRRFRGSEQRLGGKILQATSQMESLKWKDR